MTRQNGTPEIGCGARLRFGIFAMICSLAIFPVTAEGQVAAVQAVGNAAGEPAKAVQDEIRQSALQQIKEGNLEQVLKILEVPAEWTLPISMVENDSLAQVYAGVNRVLSQLDHETQFELLHKWTIPGPSPKKLRHLTALVPTVAPPVEFARALGERTRANSFSVSSIGAVRGIFSSEWLLVIAAQKAGKLKRLATELVPLVEQKFPGADRLLMLARIADDRGDVSSVIRRLSERIAQLKGEPKPTGTGPTTINPADLVLAVSSLNHRELCPLGEELLGVLLTGTHGRPAPAIRPFLRQAHAMACLIALGDPGTTDVADVFATRLKYWVPVARDLRESNSPGLKDATWLAHEDQILHLSGSVNDTLTLRYPLTGDFRFECETQLDTLLETNGSLQYDGLYFQADGSSGAFKVQDISGIVVGTRPLTVAHRADAPTFNRMSIATMSNTATMSVNQHPMWVESNGTLAGPWIGMASRGDARPQFRNLRLTGHPVIPRSARMSDTLRSWQPQAWGGEPSVNAQLESDWTISQGVIQSSRDQSERQESESSAKNRLAQSLLSYVRPLLSGEAVNYEFFYGPGVSEVHPALGRVGFLLQPDGVRIHWITDGDEWTSLAPENSVVEPLCRRGPRPLPLKSSDWNRLSVKRTDQAVTLSLNEVVIYERPVDWVGDHRFGLYRHSPKANVKVRNVELTGDWPETLPQEFLDNPTATVGKPMTTSQRHCLNRVFHEEFLAENVFAVRRKAFTMPVADRFEFLSKWVLPGPDHPGFRMTGDFTQTQPAKIAYEPGIEHPEYGGQIVSPVFDWLEAARELGRLPECVKSVEEAVTPDTDFQRRARLSLLLLLNLELGNQQAATENFDALYELLRIPTTKEQWPEALVIDRAVRRFATNDVVAKHIADMRTLKTQQAQPWKNSLWESQLASLFSRSQPSNANEKEIDADTSTFKDWIPVTAATSTTRGRGHPVARWHRVEHKAIKRANHDQDFLFYRSPLRGNFEIECDLLDSAQVMIGGSYVGVRPDRKTLDIGTFRAMAAGEPIEPQFSHFWPSMRYRAVIQDGTRSISINGRPVKSEKLPENSDPWLAIRCAGRSQGRVQDFRITGNPQILEAVPLSSSRELTGWIAYHDDRVLHESSGWNHTDDAESTGWIVGHPNPAVAGMSIESLLRYQRPLVEDGSIMYEFYYTPEAFETHPALDRLAFILHPSGVREHWIGDGRDDRTDLDPHNEIDVPACRRGPAELPLVTHAWNQLRLSLQDTTVTIELNGRLVYERNLEPTNQRTFGLFRFLGNSSVRVRNAVMQGNWPKTVPPVAAQELADDTTDKLDQELAGLNSVFSHDFQKDGNPEQYFITPAPNPTLRIIPVPQGIQASQRAIGTHTGFNIIPRFSLCGDFDIEACFTGARFEGSGDAGVMLNATTDETIRHEYRALRMKTTSGNHDLQASLGVIRPGAGAQYVAETRSFEALRGRIRLARRGQRVFYLFAENDSDHFFLFGSEPSSDADTSIHGIFLHSFCNGVSISQVTWTKLILRADRIKWYSPTVPPPQDYLSVMQADGNGLRIVAAPKSVGFASVSSPEWSSDQRRIVMEMSNGSQGTSHVFVCNADGTQLKDLGAGCMPSFSGDGTRIVCSVPDKGIVMMQSDGSAREVISAKGWGAQWSPDGTWIAIAEGDNLTLLDVSSHKTRQLLLGDAATRYRSIVNPAWSHDSRSITFKGQRKGIVREELSLMPLDPAGELKILHPNAHAVVSDVTYSPDNQQVLVGITGVASHVTKLYTLNGKGPAAPIFDVPLSAHKITGYAWSHDGKMIAITSHWSAPYVEWTSGPTSNKEFR